MMRITAEEMAAVCAGVWSDAIRDDGFVGVTQDTRQLREGMLYVALRGERFDGHDFVDEAFARGAAGALVARSFVGKGGALLRVENPLVALQQLGALNRQKWSGRAVGVTGSVGKTTVKELAAAAVRAGGEVHRTAGNYNNHIGVPLTLLGLKETHALAVVELGMSGPGEIAALANWLAPEVAILTDLGAAHRERFDSLQGIVDEKAALLRAMDSSGIAILSRNERWFEYLCDQTDASVLDVGLGVDARVRGDLVNGQLMVEGVAYALPQPGEHMAGNVLRAIGLGRSLGLTHEQMVEGLRAFRAAPMRWEQVKQAGICWVNDAYNANPLSMRAALKTFGEVQGARRFAVLGEMRELGAVAKEEHLALADYVKALRLDGWIAVGDFAEQMASRGGGVCAESVEEAAEILRSWLSEGDAVLLKGSRGLRLERVLDLY
jgi:UDP-N-acetylmuramoyl-tripeptide--D-alanyl-D-alanine ligase